MTKMNKRSKIAKRVTKRASKQDRSKIIGCDHDGEAIYVDEGVEKQWYRLHSFTSIPENKDVQGQRYMGKKLLSWADYILEQIVIDIPEDKAFLEYYKRNPNPSRSDFFKFIDIIDVLSRTDRLDIIQERVVTIFPTENAPDPDSIEETIKEVRAQRKAEVASLRELKKEKIS